MNKQLFLLFLATNLIFAENLKKNPCQEISYASVASPSNCSTYIVCLNGKVLNEMPCPTGTLFHKTIARCLSKIYFDIKDWNECLDITKKTVKKTTVNRCYTGPQVRKVDIDWVTNSSSSSKSILPDKISMTMPIKENNTRLNLTIRPHIKKDIKVITQFRGKTQDWNSSETEDWNVYGDKENSASWSVFVKEKNGTKKVFFEGMFVANNSIYRIQPENLINSQPFDPEATEKVDLNGTIHVVTKENIENLIYDREAQSVNLENSSSLMSNVEREIMKTFQVGSNKKSYGIELMVLIDYSVFFKWYMQSDETDHRRRTEDATSNIKYYYTHIISGINDRYETIKEPDMEFYVKLAGIFIATTPYDLPFIDSPSVKKYAIEVFAYEALNGFEKWMKKEYNKVPRTFPNFDVAALFTSYRLMNNQYRFISGLANIGTACTLYSLSINYDFSQYSTVGTATHEIGHNLGALHDGDGNSCSLSDGYIMASYPASLSEQNFLNPYTFSSCSKNYFRSYLDKLNNNENNCLLNPAYDIDPLSSYYFMQQNPGQRYSVDKQCQLIFNDPSSFYCAGGGEKDEMICRNLNCFDTKNNKCSTNVIQRALEGTTCGNRKWCKKSVCTEDPQAPSAKDFCIYGDLKEKFWSDGSMVTCQEMVSNKPWKCYNDHYANLCCESCLKIKNTQLEGCEYGDRDSSCSATQSFDCYDSNKLSFCCSTCLKLQKNLNVSNCRFGDKATWCSTINSLTCYNNHKTCCESCSLKKTNIPNCEYGDKTSGCTKTHCLDQNLKSSCCKTCNSFSPPKPTIFPTPSFTSLSSCQDKAFWCGSISSSDCYTSKDICCSTCQKHFRPGVSECQYGDKAAWCLNYVKEKKDCLDPTVASTCCLQCRPYITKDSVFPSCPNGDQFSFCQTLNSWDCYNYKSTCCKTCKRHYNSSDSGCEYGDKVSWCSSYVNGFDECQRPEVKDLCCKTCAAYKALSLKCVDQASWCFGMYPGYCYDENTRKTCCKTCSGFKYTVKPGCEYGDLFTWCQNKYCGTHKKECCAICS